MVFQSPFGRQSMDGPRTKATKEVTQSVGYYRGCAKRCAILLH